MVLAWLGPFGYLHGSTMMRTVSSVKSQVTAVPISSASFMLTFPRPWGARDIVLRVGQFPGIQSGGSGDSTS